MFIPHLVYPFIRPWTFQLSPQLSYCERCCKERTFLQCLIWRKFPKALFRVQLQLPNTHVEKGKPSLQSVLNCSLFKARYKTDANQRNQNKKTNYCWAGSTTCPNMNKRRLHVKTVGSRERVIIIFIFHYIKILIWREYHGCCVGHFCLYTSTT